MSSPAAYEGHRANEAAGEVGGLFARHGRMVYGICRAMLRDVHEAEDATQQVFLSAHKALLGGAAVRDAGGWLATIARNECRARIAAGMRRPLPVAEEDLEAIPDTGDDLARQAQREEIRTALAELPERQREAVVLRYLYGLRYGEVATALGLSRPATEALLFRARRAMRMSLRPVAGAVIAVPLAVREELALALPGFEERTAPALVGAGLAGGVLAKLAAGGAGVKVATATVAVATVGAVGTIGPDRPTVPRAEAAVEQPADDATQGSGADDAERDDGPGSSGDTSGDDDRSGRGGGDDDSDRADDDRSGSGSGRDDGDGAPGDDVPDDGSGSSSGSGADDDAGDGGGGDDDRSGPSDDDETTDTADTADTSGSSNSAKGSSGSSGPGGDDDREPDEPDDPKDSSGPGSGGDDEEPSGED